MKETIKNTMTELTERFVTCEEDQDPKINKDASKTLKAIKRPKFTAEKTKGAVVSTFWTEAISLFCDLNNTFQETTIDCVGLKAKVKDTMHRDISGFCPSYKKGGTNTQNKIAEKMGVGSLRHHGRYLNYDENHNINFKITSKNVVLIGAGSRMLKIPHATPLPTKSDGRDVKETMGSAYELSQNDFKDEIKATFDAIGELEAYINDQTKTTPQIDAILKELSESSIFIYEEELS